MFDSEKMPKSGGRKPRCPICRKVAAADYKPFCSDRCRQVDLNRWLAEQYRIPTDEPGAPEDFER